MDTKTAKFIIWLIICLFPAGVVFGAAADQPAQVPDKEVPNVIIISMSGVRNSESIADPTRQYFPHLFNEMLKEGTLYTDVICVEQQFHMTTFTSINLGKSSLLFYKIDRPTIFQYARKKYGWPANKCWMVGNWQGIKGYYEGEGFGEETYPDEISLGLGVSDALKAVLSLPEQEILDALRESQKDFAGFNFCNWDAFDTLAFGLFKKVLKTYHPKLIHYSCDGPDAAHYESFARYALTLSQADEIIYYLWQFIQTDPFYKDNTYLFVNPDDERNAYFRFHDSNARDNPSHVWLYVFGPGVEKGRVIKRPIHHIDIFPTVARIMEIEIPPNQGELLTEIFSSAAE